MQGVLEMKVKHQVLILAHDSHYFGVGVKSNIKSNISTYKRKYSPFYVNTKSLVFDIMIKT